MTRRCNARAGRPRRTPVSGSVVNGLGSDSVHGVGGQRCAGRAPGIAGRSGAPTGLHLLLAGAAVRLRDHVRGVLRSPTDRGPHPGGIGCTGRAAATIPHAVGGHDPEGVPGGVLDQDRHDVPGGVIVEPVVARRTTTAASSSGNRADSRCVRRSIAVRSASEVIAIQRARRRWGRSIRQPVLAPVRHRPPQRHPAPQWAGGPQRVGTSWG